MKTTVLKANPGIKQQHAKKSVILDMSQTEKLCNGIMFAQYLLVLKDVSAKVNQDFAIDSNLLSNMKDQSNA